MPWVLFAASLVLGGLSVNAVVAPRREPWTALSFALAMVPSELPVHLVAVEVAAAVAVVVAGAPGRWPGAVALAALAVGATCSVVQAVAGHRSGAVVAAALDSATGRPALPAPVPAGRRWATGWRLVLALPLRLGSVRRIRDVDYWGDGDRRHRLDLLVRRDGPAPGAPVLVYVHGGAWVLGDKREQGVPLLCELAHRGWVCVTVNYRLSPRATWPDHVVDCKRAVAWVRDHVADYGGDPSFVAVAGGSAGGHLAALVALTPGDPAWQPGFESADTSVDACVAFYGVYDVTGDPDASGRYGPGLPRLVQERVVKRTADEAPEVFAAASPDQRVTADAPPVLVLHGTHDTLVPPAVARRFVARLREVSTSTVAYVELPLAQHAFDLLCSPRSRHAVDGVVRFLDGVRTRGTTGPGPVAGSAAETVDNPGSI